MPTPISMIECQDSSANMAKFGVGKHSDITTASLLALINVSHRFGLSLGIE